MITFLGYKYNTEIEALNAVQLCNTYYGIPVSPDDITTNYCYYFFGQDTISSFYYINYYESLVVVLGQPTTITIDTPPSGSTVN